MGMGPGPYGSCEDKGHKGSSWGPLGAGEGMLQWPQITSQQEDLEGGEPSVTEHFQSQPQGSSVGNLEVCMERWLSG